MPPLYSISRCFHAAICSQIRVTMNTVLKDMLSRSVFTGTTLRFDRTLITQTYLPAGAPRQVPSHRILQRFVDDIAGHFGEYHVKENANRCIPPLVKFTRIIIKFHMRTAQNFLKMKKQIIKPKSKMKKKLLRKSLAVDAASLRLKTKILLTKKIHLKNWM